MKNLIGRKVKGFKFDKDNVYNFKFDRKVGKVGKIIGVLNGWCTVHFVDWCTVHFVDDILVYPLDQIEEHLIPEYEIGKEYQFSDDGQAWSAPFKLVGIINHEFKYLIEGGVRGAFDGYKKIREIKPKTKELTLEEIAEKFGCDVNEIKIKK